MKMMVLFSKLFNNFSRSIKEMANEYAYLLFCDKQKGSQNIPPEDKRFVEINKQYWHKAPISDKAGLILVEGFFADSGNNYVLRTGMLAKAIQSKTQYEPVVLFDKPAFKSISAANKYASFGIKRFIYIRPGISKALSYLQAGFYALKNYISLKNPDDLLKIKHQGILLGDLIYDDLIKLKDHQYTISKIDRVCLKSIFHAFFFYFSYSKIFKKYPVKFLICTHLVYVQYGLFARVGLRNGAKIIETNDLMVNYLDAKEYQNDTIAVTYHVACKHYFNKLLSNAPNKDAFVAFAEENLKERMAGSNKQYDARLAYKNKTILTKQALQERLSIPASDKPFVVIFSHVFADAPHCCINMLFRDYYDWLTQTLKHIVKIKAVNWLIKPHPSAKLYGEDGLVESLVESAVSGLERNVFVFPKEVSTSNLDQIAEAIVTVSGTAGIEFGCLGVPVILAGSPFYGNYGFTLDPASREEYFCLLDKIPAIPKLSAQQIMEAKVMYGAYIRSKVLESKIIPAEALDNIWGYGESAKSDVVQGNKLINDKLTLNDPKNEAQYRLLLENLG